MSSNESPGMEAREERPASEEHCGPAEEKAALQRRLARIEGQVRGIARMVDEERYCVDVLNQLAAVHQALRRVSRELLSRHMRTCVERAFTQGDPETKARTSQEIAELMFKYSR